MSVRIMVDYVDLKKKVQIMKKAMFVFALVLSYCAANAATAYPLTGLPSAEGAHIAQIKSMENNSWLRLPLPTPDPNFGKNYARSYGVVVPSAPNLRGGFYLGDGPHENLNPNDPTRYGDDMWFYDINQNRWISCYPGSKMAEVNTAVLNGKVYVNSDRIVVDSVGDILRLGTLDHPYSLCTYNPELSLFSWAGGQVPSLIYAGNQPAWKEGCLALNAQRDSDPRGSMFTPYFFNSQTGECSKDALSGTQQPNYVAWSVYMYVPSLKKYIFIDRNFADVWLYDAELHTWTQQTVSGNWNVGVSASACFDSRRNRLYVGGAQWSANTTAIDNFRILDINTMAWIKPSPTGSFPRFYDNNCGLIAYDSTLDKVIMLNSSFKVSENSLDEVNVYDPVANSWSGPISFPDSIATLIARSCCNCFYDEQLHAYFCYAGNDGNFVLSYDYVTPNPMLVYKFMNPEGTAVSKQPASKTVSVLNAAPNPFHGSTRIRVGCHNEPVELSIFDAAGKRVGFFTDIQKEMIWNSASRPAGMYFLKAKIGKAGYTYKLLKLE